MKTVLTVFAVLALSLGASAKTKKTTTAAAPAHHYSAPGEPLFSGDGTNEIQVGTAGNGSFATTPNGDSKTITTLDIRANYMYLLEPHWQVGGEFRFMSVSSDGNSDSGFGLLGEGAYNFDEDLRESFYGKAGLGLIAAPKDTGGKNESKFSLFVGAGKRIPLMTSVLYTPELRMYKIGNSGVTFELMFINVSLLF